MSLPQPSDFQSVGSSAYCKLFRAKKCFDRDSSNDLSTRQTFLQRSNLKRLKLNNKVAVSSHLHNNTSLANIGSLFPKGSQF